MARCQHEVAIDAELDSIAQRVLNIPTLESRKMDSLDFHEVSVWQLLAALRLAHRAGRKDRVSWVPSGLPPFLSTLVDSF